MDYVQEQADELEALESIFPDQLNVISPTQVELPCSFEAGEYGGMEYSGSFDLSFTFSETYPETAPEVHLNGLTDFMEKQESQDEATKQIESLVEENLGDPLVFVVYEGMMEWLENYLTQAKENAENAVSQAIEKEEEERLAKLTAGTLCTKETFGEWRSKFMEEVRQGKVTNYTSFIPEKKGKLTGRAQFEAAALKRLEASGKTGTNDGTLENSQVDIDESMFEGLDIDLDDLAIDSDED